MITKDMNDVRASILRQFATYLPNLDLTEGTPERDLFVEAPLAGFISPLWSYATYIAQLQSPMVYSSNLAVDDINNYINTFQIIPVSATYASGTVTFFTYNKPKADIVIGTGTTVTTTSNPPNQYVTTTTAVIYLSNNVPYYNAASQRWEITTNVQSNTAGSGYGAGANTVTRIPTRINGIDGCTNVMPIIDGSPAESITSKLQKVTQKFQGRDLSSTSGTKSYIKSLSSNANVVLAGDPLMLRDGGLGGCIDVYVMDQNLVTTSDTLSITFTGLTNPTNVKYTSTTIKFINQPVNSLVSLLRTIGGVTTTTSSTQYTLVQDTGVLQYSTNSSDKLKLIETNGYQTWGFLPNIQVVSSSPTGLNNDITNYGFNVNIDGGASQTILLLGSNIQTIDQLCNQITTAIPSATCTFDSTNMLITLTSNSTGHASSITMVDGPNISITGSIAPNSPYGTLTVTAVNSGVLSKGNLATNVAGTSITGTGIATGTVITEQTLGIPLTGYISGKTLTVVSITGALSIGVTITSSTSILSNTVVVSQLTGPTFTGTIAAGSNHLIVTAVTSGTLNIGAIITGTNINVGTVISSFISGTNGGVGTYTISSSPTYNATVTGTTNGTGTYTVSISQNTGTITSPLFITGYGGIGTYTVNKSQTVDSTSITGTDKSLFKSMLNTNLIPNVAISGIDIVPFSAGEQVQVTYVYNSALASISDTLTSAANLYVNRNYLVREMVEVLIDLYCQFSVVAGQDFNAISIKVQSAVITYISNNSTKNYLDLADIITTIKQVNGVSNLNVATLSITSASVGVTKVGTDLHIGSNQFMSANSFIMVPWTT